MSRGNAEAEQEAGLRRALLAAAQRMESLGLNTGSAGNASVRLGEGLLITPSGVQPSQMGDADLVRMRADGAWRTASAGRRPSSEWRMHRDLLASRPDLNAVVHAHPPAATALACLRRGLPSFHYMVAVAGGDDIRCAPYATFGTQALSGLVLEAMRDRRACLMANHGVLAAGADVDAALLLLQQVEGLADSYLRALAAGEPVLLTAAEMEEAKAMFAAGYGRDTREDGSGTRQKFRKMLRCRRRHDRHARGRGGPELARRQPRRAAVRQWWRAHRSVAALPIAGRASPVLSAARRRSTGSRAARGSRSRAAAPCARRRPAGAGCRSAAVPAASPTRARAARGRR